MARLRLFGPVREAAGTASTDVAGNTVAEIIAVATAQFGPRFEKFLPSCRIWVNGDLAGPECRVGAGDEVAIIPPVSGG